MTLTNRVLNVLVVLTTLAAAVTLVYRFVMSRAVDDSALISVRTDWREFASEGMIVGGAAAPVTITVFSDFQCPFCKTLADSISRILPRYEGRVRMVFRNRPLETIHSHAEEAARAAVCAHRQGRFPAFHDLLFEDQEQIGIRSWSDFAVAAQLPDTAAFTLCRADPDVNQRVLVDVEAANKLKLTGTPLLLVNETMIRGVPPGRALDSIVQQAIRAAESRP